MALKGYEFERKKISLESFTPKGRVLDLGGGGEGVIGLFGGPDQVSVDMRMDELRGTRKGPLKVVMDARRLALPAESFDTVTAFFSLMYISETADLEQVFAEAHRVLRPGGDLHIWDVNLPETHLDSTDYFIIQLEIKMPEATITTGYGASWPDTPRENSYYLEIADKVGFQIFVIDRDEHTFYQRYQKEN